VIFKYKQLYIGDSRYGGIIEEDKLAVSRARRVQRFISTIPCCRAIYWFERGFIIKDTINNMIIDGEVDHLPNQHSTLKGQLKKLLRLEKNVA
jgi:F-type H+-transporting ATPase subunit beta